MTFPVRDRKQAASNAAEKIRKVTVVAHRGGRFDEPNTLANFKKALNYAQLNPQVRFMIELDVQQCKAGQADGSGELVVIHDSTVNSTTYHKGRVYEFTLDELRDMTIKPSFRAMIPPEVFEGESVSDALLLDVEKGDVRIPSLQEVLNLADLVNDDRHRRGVSLVSVGIDFTHVASRLDRFKDHFLYPLFEKVSPGSQIHKVSPPESLLNRLAEEISIRKGKTPIQIISQGVHGRRNLCMLMKLIEELNGSFSIAVQASTSLFPADSRDMRATLPMEDEKFLDLIKGKRFTINYNHRWDRFAYHLRRFTGFNIRNPYALLPDHFAMSNKEAMKVAREEGFRAGFWTVNSAGAIRDVVLWGADAVTTDYPPRAASVIESIAQEIESREARKSRIEQILARSSTSIPLRNPLLGDAARDEAEAESALIST